MSKFILCIRFSNFSSAYGEYNEFRNVCGTQNCLRIRGKNLCVHGEDTKRHKAVNILFYNNTNFNFCSFYLHCMG
jgi:hypothetical protein